MTDTATRPAGQLRDALKAAHDELPTAQFEAVVHEFTELRVETEEILIEREPDGLAEAIDQAGQAVHEGHDRFQWWQCSHVACVAVREIPGAPSRRYD